MSRPSHPTKLSRLGLRPLLFTLAASGALLLAACGGGGGGEPPRAQASSFTSGAITGFGSVIVNGVRFDDAAAELVDEDGQRLGRDRRRPAPGP